jgi:hypothetical protein
MANAQRIASAFRLLADESGLLALDARVSATAVTPKFKGRRHPRLAIRPYPNEWVRRLVLSGDWRILVRPVRPEDASLVHGFFEKVSQDAFACGSLHQYRRRSAAWRTRMRRALFGQ